MANTDFGAGLDRLFALVTDDLSDRIDGTNLAAVTAWGTVFNALHLARGMRTLHDAGCCAAAVPVFRSLLEYTVGTMWLADAGGEAVEVLNRAMAYTHTRLNKSLNSVEELSAWRERMPEEAVRTFESVLSAQLGPHPDERLSGFTTLLEEYGFEGWVPIYNALSTFSHLSLPGAERYVRTSATGWNASQMPFEAEVAPCLEVSFGLLVDAMAAFDTLLVGNPWCEELEQIATEYEATITHAKRRTGRHQHASDT
jgi:Family of unknown function (DUF5677)